MTRTEERLTDALAARAAAVAAESLHPLPAAGLNTLRRHLTNRRWSVSLAPLAAAASIAAITAVVATLPHHHDHRLASGLPAHSELLGVAATSANSAWAVGTTLGKRFRPLIMRWDGKSWTRSPIAAPVKKGILWAVAALSRRDAWAVGGVAIGHDNRPYILHWNGSIWRSVPVPRTSKPTLLGGVSVFSPADAWAVGGPNGAVILHWNGVKWQMVPTRWSSVQGRLFGVFATSASDVWAVGRTGFNALILHWNGVTWTRLGGPRFDRYYTKIAGVGEVSHRLTWMVGIARRGPPLIAVWNGAQLRQLPMPKPSRSGGLVSVSALSARQAWAGGWSDAPSGGIRTLIMRWQGHGWQRVPSPRQVADGSIESIAAVSAKDAWAVGFTRLGTLTRAFILHWNGARWQVAG